MKRKCKYSLKKPSQVKYDRGILSFRPIQQKSRYHIAILSPKEERVMYLTAISNICGKDKRIAFRLKDAVNWNVRHTIKSGRFILRIFAESEHPKRKREKVQNQTDFTFNLSYGAARRLRDHVAKLPAKEFKPYRPHLHVTVRSGEPISLPIGQPANILPFHSTDQDFQFRRKYVLPAITGAIVAVIRSAWSR